MSTNTHANSDYPLAAVQFSRLTKRGIMLGLSLPQLIVLGIAVLTVVFSLYLGGGLAFAWTAPVWATAALLAVIPAGGRKVIEWVPIVARWIARTYLGQLIYRRRVIPASAVGGHVIMSKRRFDLQECVIAAWGAVCLRVLELLLVLFPQVRQGAGW